jgi:2-oxoglutarate dehydrogenase E2 component (dihydrolipoamide succinyltransferase)
MQAVGAVVCLIDTEGAKPEGSDKSEGSTAEVAPAAPVAEARKKAAAAPARPPAATRLRHMLQGHLSSCKKILDEKIPTTLFVKGTGDGRVTKDDAVNATPSMELLQEEAAHLSVQNFQCYDVK